MNENMENRYELLVKWLRVLMYIAIVSLVNSVVNFLPFVPAALTTWVSRGIMVAVVVCMFQLTPANERYKKAGIMRAVMLVCTLVTAFVYASSVLNLAASILSIIAVYQEYHGHSELIAEMDAKLSGRWSSLFTWSILAAVLLSFGASVVAVILVLADMEGGASRISAIAIGLLSIPQCIIDLVYISYIKKMIALFENKEVQ